MPHWITFQIPPLEMRTAIPCESCSFSDVHNCRGQFMTRQCLNSASKTRTMQVVGSVTVWTSQLIPHHVNVLFNDVMIIYRTSEQYIERDGMCLRGWCDVVVVSYVVCYVGLLCIPPAFSGQCGSMDISRALYYYVDYFFSLFLSPSHGSAPTCFFGSCFGTDWDFQTNGLTF